ncbi:MAG: MFS transporter [Actinomycetota bacterium]
MALAPAVTGGVVTSDKARSFGPLLSVLLVAALCFSVAQTTVIAALPEITRSFGATAATASWTVTAYLISASVCTPLAGKLGDVLGKGRVLGWVMLIFSLGSVVCAVAPSVEVLIAGRVLQGVAGGAFPLAFGIIHDEFPPERRGFGVALVSGMFGGGAAAGLLLAGIIIDNGDLSWIFWGLLVMALPGALASWKIVPPSPARERKAIDWAGAALLSLGLAGVLLGFSKGNLWGWTSPATLVCLIGGAVVLVVFVAVQMRVTDALINMRVMRSRTVLATNLASLVSGIAMFSAYVLVPRLAQTSTDTGYGLGLSLTDSCLVTLPMVGMIFVATPVVGALGRRMGFRSVFLIGITTVLVSFVLLALDHGSAVQLLGGVTVLGIGIALSLAGMSMLVITAVPKEEVGIASGINTVMRLVGAAFGTTVVTAVLDAGAITGSSLPTEQAYVNAFFLSAAIAAVAVVIALCIPRDIPSQNAD